MDQPMNATSTMLIMFVLRGHKTLISPKNALVLGKIKKELKRNYINNTILKNI
jgi:hypothetical protein